MPDSFSGALWILWVTYPFHVLTAAIALKCVLILFYANLLYWLIRAVKKLAGNRMGVRAGYYIWYSLLLAVPISGFSFNGVVKAPVMKLFDNYTNSTWVAATIAVALWVLVVLYRLEAHIITTSRLGYTSGLMKSADVGDLKDRAAAAFGLRSKRINVAEAGWVSSPVTYGVFRKTILLHEMAHIKNGDMTKLYFISIANCLFLVPPGFLRDFKRDSEILCDNRVIGVSNTNVDSYTDLLIRESAHKTAPIKGIAFSDSFRAVKSRANALEQFSPVKHRFAVFSAVILVALLAAAYHAYTTPDAWYLETYPEIPEIDMYVVFEGEDIEELSNEYREYIYNGGVMPRIKDDRPRLAELAGTYDFPGNGQIRYDLFAQQDAISGMEKDGREAAFISVVKKEYGFFSDGRSVSVGAKNTFAEGFNVDENGETMRYYQDYSISGNKYIHTLVAYWL